MEQSTTLMDEELQIVAFKLGKEEFGVEISQVREIIKMTAVTEIPNTPEFMEGVINLRGTITPVIDLRRALGIASEQERADMRIVIVEQENDTAKARHDNTIVGMVVDDVSEVMRLKQGDIDTNPMMQSDSDVSTEYIRGVGKLENRLLILLDLNRVLTKGELSKLNEIGKKAAKTEIAAE